MFGSWSGGGKPLPSEDKFLISPYRYFIDFDNKIINFVIQDIKFELKLIGNSAILQGTALMIGSYGTKYKENIVLKKKVISHWQKNPILID